MTQPAFDLHYSDDKPSPEAAIMTIATVDTKKRNDKERSPVVVAFALFVGLTAQVFGGPIAGIVGAAIAATAGGVAVRIHDHKAG